MNRHRNTIAVLLLLAVAVPVFAGCSSAGSSGDPLKGTSWRLSGWSISSIDPASVTITAKFADGQISGNSGVNSYGGPYTLGPGNTLAIGAIVMTEMAGPDLNMRAESAYDKLLADTGSYKLADGTLTLFDKAGNETLIFAPAAQ